ncbi:MAG: helix-turn-helix domain-containing protein [bacterium]
MKRVTQLNHYEILDLKPTATKSEIQQSFSRLRKTYEADSLAVYSILSEDEREDMMARIEDAYRILIDEEKRYNYDQSLGLQTLEEQEEAASEKFISKKSRKRSDKKEKTAKDTASIDPLSQDFLKRVREKKGISLKDIAESTNIRIYMLSALEDGEYRKLPGRAYAIGFLREYAKYLGIDYQTAKQNLDMWAKW